MDNLWVILGGERLSVDAAEQINGLIATVAGVVLGDLTKLSEETKSKLRVATADCKGVRLVNKGAANLPSFETLEKKRENRRMATVSNVHTVDTDVRAGEQVTEALFRDEDEPTVLAPVPHGANGPLFYCQCRRILSQVQWEMWCDDSDLVFGSTTKPRWSYGVSKAIDEFLALAFHHEMGVPVVIGRFFNVVGPRQTGAYGMVLPRFVQAAIAGKPLIVHDDGRQQRCFAHVSDVIGAVVRLVETPAAVGRVYNIGSDQPISILELAQRVIARVNPSATIEFQSYSAAYDETFEDIRRRVPDLTRIAAAIGFRPTHTLDEIIDSVAQSLR